MADLNQVQLIGRLGQNPTERSLPSGGSVVNFSVATSKKLKEGERTEWHRIVAFGKLAETCAKYLSKGRQVYVQGELQTRSYDKDGVTRYTTEILANYVLFLGDRGDVHSYGDNDDLF